jgi:hypothetical protein
MQRLLPFAFVAMFGCTYRTPDVHLPAAFPGFRADALELSSVVVHAHGQEVSSETAFNVRRTVREMLVDAASDRATSSQATRVTVRVDVQRSEDWVYNAGRTDGCGAVPFVFAAPTGTKIEDEALSVEVEIETNGRHFWGRGDAHKDGSLYAPARRRALAVALDEALANAAKHPID